MPDRAFAPLIQTLAPDLPVLIAGPTASGKSALALAIAEAQGGTVINADALQMFQGWPILTAQPGRQDQARAPHALYSARPYNADYSVGAWLRDVAPLLCQTRPIIIGGTGLYLSALTEGLADIPPVPAAIRAEADDLPLDTLRSELDPATAARIDLKNRARVQRAWEVLRATGRPLAEWQDATPPPLLPLVKAQALVLHAPKSWLDPRIAGRFQTMLATGVLEEARAMQPRWDPTLLSSKAIGAAEMIAHLEGRMSLETLAQAIQIGSRRYAKRQRTWFRRRMRDWRWIDAETGASIRPAF